ncbi:MAG: hypothetical protein ACOC8N_06370, partial [Spirochaetota bacterium]
LEPVEVRYILQQSAIDLGSAGKDKQYGYGLLNVYEAVRMAQQYPDTPNMDPVLHPRNTEEPYTKRALFSGTGLTGTGVSGHASFTLVNIGGDGNITIQSIEKIEKTPGDADWLTIDPSGSVDSEAPLTVDLYVTSAGIEDGRTHTATLEILWSSNIGSSGSEFFYVLYNSEGFIEDYADLGDVYVVAIDNDTGAIAFYDITDAEQNFEYLIQNITPGSYFVGASTDSNNNGRIFEPGIDVYGFYPSDSFIQVFDFKRGDTLNDINFTISNTH